MESALNKIFHWYKSEKDNLKEKKCDIKFVKELIFKNYDELLNTTLIYKDNFELKDYLIIHSSYSCVIMMKLAKMYGFSKEETINSGIAGLLHDIGMFFIPDEIYLSEKKLTEEELEIIRKHPEEGMLYLLNFSDISSKTISAVYEHHERLDGTGYPRKIKDGEISFMGKMLQITDVYDALSRRREYRKGYFAHELLKRLAFLTKTSLNGDILKKFLEFFPVYPIGKKVLLSNNETYEIIDRGTNPFRPVVENSNGRIDLNDQGFWSMYIVKVVNSQE
ncbi:HD domain-containing protein [bacterium]|nr:HD domain-containing protein [bacterium]